MKLPLINLPKSDAPADSYERRLNAKLNEILNDIRHILNVNAPQDFFFEVARGNIPGMIGVTKFGKNPDVDSGTSEDIWSQGGTWTPPTVARVHNIVSSDVNDDGSPAGTGARTVYVEGLDTNYAVISETITMNGTTNVATANAYTIIHVLRVETAGASGPNVGTITATAVTDATVSSAILPAKGQNQTGVYQVPAGYTAYLSTFSGSIDTTTSGSCDIELFVKPFGGTFNLKDTLMFVGSGTSARGRDYTTPLRITEKSIIKMRATTDTNNVDTTGWFNLILVRN